MPALLTHDQFGRDVLDDVSSVVDLSTQDEKDAFLLGNQGPDPLFYLTANPLEARWEPYGDLMHHARPAQLMLALRDSLGYLNGHDLPIGRAYLAGFCCHYLLDRAEHPLVFSWQYGLCDAGVPGLDRTAGGKVHAEIERDLDEMVLFARQGVTVDAYPPFDHVLKGSADVLKAINKMYSRALLWTYSEPVSNIIFSTAVRSFRRVQHVFYSPTDVSRLVLSGVERLITRKRFSLLGAMTHRVRPEATSDFDNRDHRPWVDPFTGAVRTEGFWDLYHEAAAEAVPAVTLLLERGFDLADAEALTRNLNFSGEPAPVDGTVE